MYNIDVLSRVPVYEQLINQTEKYLLSGVLKPGDKLGSVRQLSSELGVNPNTIQKCFGIMDQKGLTVSVPGRGVFIAQDAIEKIKSQIMGKTSELKEDIRELKMAGVSLEEIIQIVRDVYGEMMR